MIELDFINNVAPSLGYMSGQIRRQYPIAFASKENLSFQLRQTAQGLRLEIKGRRTYNTGYVDLIDLVKQEMYEVKSIRSEPLGRAELYWYLSFKKGYKPGSLQYSPSPRTIGPWPTDPQYVVRAEIRGGVIVYWGVKRDSDRVRVGAPAVDPYTVALLIAAGTGALLGGQIKGGRNPKPVPGFSMDGLCDPYMIPKMVPYPDVSDPPYQPVDSLVA
jgi:hypothetical protein